MRDAYSSFFSAFSKIDGTASPTAAHHHHRRVTAAATTVRSVRCAMMTGSVNPETTTPSVPANAFAGINGFGTVYVLRRTTATLDLQVMPFTLEDARAWLPDVGLQVNGPYAKITNLPSESPGSVQLRVGCAGAPHVGPRSSTLYGFLGSSVDDAMQQLNRALRPNE